MIKKLAKIVDLCGEVAKDIEKKITPSCLTCVYSNVPKEMCEKFNSRPPWKFVVKGCEHYDYLPF